MKFRGLIVRELHWWWRCYALWWTILLFILIFALLPVKILYLLFMNTSFAELELQWGSLGFLYRSWAEENRIYVMALTSVVRGAGALDEALRLPFAEVWQIYALPLLKAWGIFTIAFTAAPLALWTLTRDRDSGFLVHYRACGGRPLTYLFAKLFVNGLQLGWMQILSMLVYLQALSWLTGYPEWYSPADLLTLLCWLPGGLCLGLLGITVSWLACLLSRSGIGEIYNSMILSFLAVIPALGYLTVWGVSAQSVILLAAGCLLVALALCAVMAVWICAKFCSPYDRPFGSL
ncbi:MAG: hypothetical protein HQL31_05925 [Planctomycetes bacterium]|nr:hypothetical protein [Planctomycetota bacterium]